jgi:hypothetical protein
MIKLIRRARCGLGLLAPLLVVSSAGAQSVLFQVGGENDDDHFGRPAAAGDVNLDGVPDILAASPFALGGGYVKVLSGVDGAQICKLTAPDLTGHRLGWSLAGGQDVNGDGVSDFVAGAQTNGAGSGYARVYSGADGSVLHTFAGTAGGDAFGNAVLLPGDLNGDGRSEIAVGAPHAGASSSIGYVRVLSGADGSELYTAVPAPTGFWAMGSSLAAIDDIDGDGVVDLLVGAPGASPPGRMVVLSGATGATLYSLLGNGLSDHLGLSVADVGDIDGDGLHDMAASAHSDGGHGYVKIFSGVDGSVLRTQAAPPTELTFGDGLAGLGDLDGDGLSDYAISASGSFFAPGYVDVYSGKDARRIWRHSSSALNDEFGTDVAAVGDLNGDGFPDLVVAVPGTCCNGTDKGYVRTLSPCPMPVQVYCTAKLNSKACVPAIHSSGSATLSDPDDLTIGAQNVLSLANGILFWGFTPNATAFGGGTLCVVPVARVGAQSSGGNFPVDCSGTFSHLFSQSYMQSQAIAAGSTVRAQWWYRDTGFAPPGNLGLTDAVLFTVTP